MDQHAFPSGGLPLPDRALQDSGILLRELKKKDIPALVHLCGRDPDILKWVMRPNPFDERAATNWVNERRKALRAGKQLTLAIADRKADELIGSIWLGRFDWIARRGEFAYWVGRPFRGQGVAVRALQLFSTWAFQTLGLTRTEILVPVENRASLAAALRAGFTREGVLRKYRRILGEPYDHVILSRLDSDPPATIR